MGLQDTPYTNRLHIAIYGKRNSGKSTLLNMLCGQDVSLVSEVAGTTTDPVIKAMELHGIGPVVLYDTAGFDDEGVLGLQRIERTKKVVEKTDIAILLFHDMNIDEELVWYQGLKKQKKEVLCIYNTKQQADLHTIQAIKDIIKGELLVLDTSKTASREVIREQLLRLLPGDISNEHITGHFVKPGDIVLLVMPQDIQAPKGRLILPQVQTIRDLLDHHCIVQSCTLDQLDQTLSVFKKAPDFIITDSQVFKEVYAKKPQDTLLTSFSVLFARHKGDIDYFIKGANAMKKLHETSRILIAEACSHTPTNEDIGRVKLPMMLKKRFGDQLDITIVNGTDFPADLQMYDLIIHCGACMFHRTYVMHRVEQAKRQHVAMCNYGIAIAWLQGILDKIII